ncbi:transporter substrate-binding domain-containing protein [Rouxiella badensis]|uniref:transporter substrate-binding domain-containing protein n=1 Tax=Rouxiella badensis TaxID=1646377 RepID=UPI00037809D6|nr:transporter substrate-binding domain-containing protein [Rouxiella badensis]MCC3719920.1 transporter substrate-binding domain-containing protein [Rouxiella badensis]MCC3729228.1 transporter substrate-binding domain-containing protein [Rouxiella badensis]MCC3733441.1 transporter substrate-binding domain-containing protein [Rouxiella badensis]MCC3742138.1 transporter substrate-binding domain-containing protein [Rouxiella badensis]MCC3749144.1 transporter substrate-binding domain-containing pr
MKKLLPWVLLVAAGSASAESHLQTVVKQGALNVCTTGDYKPYTFLKPDGSYEGIDISMAESLAKSLGVKVNFVKSTWKTLTPDLVAGKCDIAMGGISVTLARQQQAFFAERMDVDGKIPLVRCTDVKKYQTLEQINNPSVRVIEPAGGTNEAFAHAFLPKSTLTLSHDNAGIFQQLVDNQADVMVTEASEALYQKKSHPSLCAVNPDKPMQYGEKSYMLPTDDISWKLYVDQWLHLARATGEYQKIVANWM